MSTTGFQQRRKGEELIKQRFSNLLATLHSKKKQAEEGLRDKLEGKTILDKLRTERKAVEEECERLQVRAADVRDKIETLEKGITKQVTNLTRELTDAVTSLEARLNDEERALVEQLWMDSLSSDLKDLLGKVPTAQDLLTNGVSKCFERLSLK